MNFVLTALFMSLVSGAATAQILTYNSEKNYERVSLKVPKDRIVVTKDQQNQSLKIETLDYELYKQIVQDIKKTKFGPQYFKSIENQDQQYPEKPLSINFQLASAGVSSFNFYKENEGVYNLDFWIEESAASEAPKATMPASPNGKRELSGAPGKVATATTEVKKAASTLKQLEGPTEEEKNRILELQKMIVGDTGKVAASEGQSTLFRDFRYGAALIWNYSPHLPKIKELINVQSKTPEFFFPVQDRDKKAIDKDEKEVHLQLCINLYKKEKYGLMSKSIELYNQKYKGEKGGDLAQDLFQYLKANALLKENMGGKNRGPIKLALGMFKNLALKTDNYDLKRALYFYMIQDALNNKDYVQSMDLGRQFLVNARESFDKESSEQAVEVVFHSLAKLKQMDDLVEFASEPYISKLVPKQIRLAFESYTLLSKEQNRKVIDLIAEHKKSLVKPVHPSILFNLAEAYFREARYVEATQTFDEYLDNYSFESESSQARLRIALSHDLLNRDPIQGLELYRNALDRSGPNDVRIEAKLRYVGLNFIRRLSPGEKEAETLVFLELEEHEKKLMDAELKRMLWLVRLRSFINQKKFDEALAYLRVIPMDTLPMDFKNTLTADGAEVLFGLVQRHYQDQDYPKLVKVWEVYRDIYTRATAGDAQLSFMVCDSYLKLNLDQSFSNCLKQLTQNQGDENAKHTFPVWSARKNLTNPKTLVGELRMIKLLQQDRFDDALELLKDPAMVSYLKAPYYEGLIQFKLGKFKEAAAAFEKYVLGKKDDHLMTNNDLSQMLLSYCDSLYRLNDYAHFKLVSQALIQDISKLQNPTNQIKGIKERLGYLLIEVLSASDTAENYLLMEPRIREFKKEFSKSSYIGRINYLFGLALIKNSKGEEAKKVLGELINDKGTPSYMKEMANTELSALEIRNRSS